MELPPHHLKKKVVISALVKLNTNTNTCFEITTTLFKCNLLHNHQKLQKEVLAKLDVCIYMCKLQLMHFLIERDFAQEQQTIKFDN